jgi:hypothetical protein
MRFMCPGRRHKGAACAAQGAYCGVQGGASEVQVVTHARPKAAADLPLPVLVQPAAIAILLPIGVQERPLGSCQAAAGGTFMCFCCW